MSTMLGGVLVIGIVASLAPRDRAEPPAASIDADRAHAEAAHATHSHAA
jgi:hypothetical protein